jgi:hypothetical protein
MNAPWKVTHDPLRLMDATGELSHLEDAARQQGEDLVQAERLDSGRKVVLDLGWYADRYQVTLIGDDWSSPLKKAGAADLPSAVAIFRQFAA